MKKYLFWCGFAPLCALGVSQAQAGSGFVNPAFVQKGPGTVARSVADKLSESVSVLDFGAKRGGVDDFAAFQRAIDALPAGGGRIAVPDGAYVLSKQPNWGTKSIFWDIGTGATFTGDGTGQNKFPSMKTNGGQIAAGPWIQSQSRIPYTYSSPFAGGVAAFQAEMIQPADVVGQSVALYAGAEGSNPHPNANVWALNLLVKADHGAGGVYQGAEIDIDVFSPDAYMKGISLNGIGDYDADVGLEIIRADETKWAVGIDIMNSIVGMQVRKTDGLEMGVAVGEPTAQASAAITAKLLKNGGDGLVVQRATDTAPTGNVLRVVNAANSANLASIDVQGNADLQSVNINGGATVKGLAAVQSVQFTGGAVAGAPGVLSLGNTKAAAATAGTSGALPNQVAGYLVALVGSTIIKIPYYND